MLTWKEAWQFVHDCFEQSKLMPTTNEDSEPGILCTQYLLPNDGGMGIAHGLCNIIFDLYETENIGRALKDEMCRKIDDYIGGRIWG